MAIPGQCCIGDPTRALDHPTPCLRALLMEEFNPSWCWVPAGPASPTFSKSNVLWLTSTTKYVLPIYTWPNHRDDTSSPSLQSLSSKSSQWLRRLWAEPNVPDHDDHYSVSLHTLYMLAGHAYYVATGFISRRAGEIGSRQCAPL